MLCIFVLAACLTAHASAGYSQYFYSGFPTPIQPAYQPNYYQSPIAYQSFVPQYPTPATTYQTQHYVPQAQVFPAHQTFGYQQSFPLQFTYTQPTLQLAPPEQATNTTPQTQPQPTTTTEAPKNEVEDVNQEIDESEAGQDDTVITNAVFRSAATPAPLINNPNSVDNFRGFAYRNEFQGGQSHFVFITGPEAHQFRHSQNQARPTSARTSASDAIDSVATTTQTDHSLDALVRYLENPQIGVQKFYSVNNALVMRRVEDEIPALPAPVASVQGSLPITQPISPLFTLLRSSFQLNVETTTANNEEKQGDKEVQEGSASQIEAKSVAPETSSSTTTTTPASVSSTSTSTTTSAPLSSSSTSTTTVPVAEITTATTPARSTMEPIVVE